MTVTYENINTPGQTATFAEPNPRLEALDNWRRVEGAAADAGPETVVGRSQAERDGIEAAGRRRLREAGARHDAAATIAAASAAGQPQPAPAPQTASHTAPLGVRQPDGVLTRAKKDHQAGAFQIGDDDPAAHPRTREGLEAKAAADSKAIHAAGTGADNGVLTRGRTALAEATGAVSAEEAAEQAATAAEGTGAGDPAGPPARNASTDTWRTHLVEACGVPADEVDGLGRDDLIAKYDALPSA